MNQSLGVQADRPGQWCSCGCVDEPVASVVSGGLRTVAYPVARLFASSIQVVGNVARGNGRPTPPWYAGGSPVRPVGMISIAGPDRRATDGPPDLT